MSCRAVWMFAFLLSFGASAASAQAPAPGSLDARAHALKGQVELANLPHPSGIEWGRAEGVVDAAPSDVLAILGDYSSYAGVFPYFEKSKVLSQRGSDALVYLEAKILYGASTLWSQVKITARSPTPTTRVIEVKMMKGKGNIGNLLARFEVTPIDGGQKTFVAFQFLVDPDLPMPDSVVSSEMKKGAGSAFRALRKKVAQRVYASRTNHAM